VNGPSQTGSRRKEAAAFGQSMLSVNWPRMRLISWKPLVKGSLCGFAAVELPIGLKIFHCPVLTGANGPWASLPSKPQVDKGGQKTDVNGKGAYTPVCEWRDRSLSNRFSGAVVTLVRAEHPADREEGEVR
jgi:hypothetical protein